MNLGPRKKLLYVEDDESAWRVVHRWLREDFVLVRAVNEREACVMLRQFGRELDGVLCDVNLGGELSGIDLARLVRGTNTRPLPAWAEGVPQLKPEVPIIIITGDPSKNALAQEAGATLVLDKPIDFAALRRALGA